METHPDRDAPGAPAPPAPWSGADLAALIAAGLDHQAANPGERLGPPATERGVLAALSGAVLTKLGRALRSTRDLALALELHDALDDLRTSRGEVGPFLPNDDDGRFLNPSSGLIAAQIVEAMEVELAGRDRDDLAWANDLRRLVAAREEAHRRAPHGRRPPPPLPFDRVPFDRDLLVVASRDAEADAVVEVRRDRRDGDGLLLGLVMLGGLAATRRIYRFDRPTAMALALRRAS